MSSSALREFRALRRGWGHLAAALPRAGLQECARQLTRRLLAPLPALACSALCSGDFYREILPVMYDASIIDQDRFLKLMVRWQRGWGGTLRLHAQAQRCCRRCGGLWRCQIV